MCAPLIGGGPSILSIDRIKLCPSHVIRTMMFSPCPEERPLRSQTSRATAHFPAEATTTK